MIVTAGAVRLEAQPWRNRWLACWSIRICVALLPLLAAAGVTAAVQSVIDQPSGGVVAVAWWGGIITVVSVAAALMARWRQRLPLALTTSADPGSASKRLVTPPIETPFERPVAEPITGSGGPENHTARALLSLLGLLGEHDAATRDHCERVAGVVELIGEQMGLGSADVERLTWAALLHDIGTLSVPPEVLTALREPARGDRSPILDHPVAATAYLTEVSAWLGEWSLAAMEHHERWDGSGYPSGLRGDAISRAGRIVAVADAFDVATMTSSRRTAIAVGRARRDLARGAGSRFDPEVVRALLCIPRRRLLALCERGHERARRPGVPQMATLAAGAAVVVVAIATGTTFLTDRRPAESDVIAVVNRMVENEPIMTVPTTTSGPRTNDPGETPVKEFPRATPGVSPLALLETMIPRRVPTTSSSPMGRGPARMPIGSGFVVVDPADLPPDLSDGQLTSDDHAFVWFESLAFTDAPLSVRDPNEGDMFTGERSTTQTVLPPGTTVCPVFVHIDPVGSSAPMHVELDFGVMPFGFLLRGEHLDASGSFGVAGVDYRSDGMGFDDVGSMVGTTIELRMNPSLSGRDQLRILFPC